MRWAQRRHQGATVTYALIAALIFVVGAIMTLTLLNRKDVRELLHARDIIDAERKLRQAVTEDRDALTVELAVTRDTLKREAALRTAAETQRNSAALEERKQLVERIRLSGVGDAQHLIAGLLAAPLLGPVAADGLPQVPAADPAKADPDALIDPNAV
jgi:hypothetical protein